MAEEINLKINSNIDDAAKDVKKLTDNLSDAVDESNNLSKASKKGETGIKKLAVGFKTLTKATGIVFILNKAFEVFEEVLGQNQKVVDGLKTGTEFLSIAFNDLFRFISNNVGTITGFFKDLFENPKERINDLKDAIKQGIIDRFNEFVEVLGLAGKAFGQFIKGEFSAAFDTVKEAGKQVVDVYTGVDDSVDKVKKTIKTTVEGIKEYTKSTFEAAKSNVELDKQAALAESRNRILLEQFDAQAEKLRQVRDDENLTFEQRIEANNKLGELLKEQNSTMLANADIAVEAAQKELDKNKDNVELQIALNEAIAEREGIIAQVTGFESEQLTNTISLKREQQDLEKELQEKELERLQEIEDKNQEIADANKARKEAELEAFSQLAGSLGALAGENKALAIAQATIDTFAGANKAFAQGGVAGFVTGAAVIAGGLANIRKIIATDVPGGGGGGSVPSATQQAPAPQMVSGAFSLSGATPDIEPTRAFVVSDDITNSQNKLANIRRRATI